MVVVVSRWFDAGSWRHGWTPARSGTCKEVTAKYRQREGQRLEPREGSSREADVSRAGRDFLTSERKDGSDSLMRVEHFLSINGDGDDERMASAWTGQ